MKYFIRTYGCQMNERDSEALGAALEKAGFLPGTEEDSDLLLFNTCSVRDAAERKAKGKIGYIRKLKRKNPNLIIGVTGCMAQRLGEELLNELPHLDFVLGTGQMQRLVPLVNEIAADRRRRVETEPSVEVLESMGDHDASPSWHGQIAITRGCNRFCSYCIVPYVRGREISRTKGSIITEAKELVAKGVKEIMLLGQNVAAYGLNGDTRPPVSGHSPFAELLEEMNEIPGLLRIRFTSPYVSYFNDRLIAALKNCSKVCHNVHLPLQSGSNRILKAMNRQYTAESYLAKVDEIRAAIPDVTFSTDVIVGFPGEEESDFLMTREVMNKVGFEQAYVFKYSPRPGALSALLADSIPDAVKEERNQILLGDLKERVVQKLKSLKGETVEVLLEGVSARNAARWSGRTSTSFVVHFEPDAKCLPGTLRKVRITQVNTVSLFGSCQQRFFLHCRIKSRPGVTEELFAGFGVIAQLDLPVGIPQRYMQIQFMIAPAAVGKVKAAIRHCSGGVLHINGVEFRQHKGKFRGAFVFLPLFDQFHFRLLQEPGFDQPLLAGKNGRRFF